MQEMVKRLSGQITELWERTEKKNCVRVFVIVGLAVAVIIIAIMLLTQTEYDVLYREMEPAQAGEVLAVLQEMGVPARTSGTDTILVPRKDVDRLAMELSARGYPKSGFTYDIFKQGSGFGSTDYDKRKYEQFDLQDRLERTIAQQTNVQRAIVTLALPDATRVLYQSEREDPKASVMLYLRDGGDLSAENIAAIENLVSSAVNGLKPENVSITDNFLRLLNHRDGFDVIEDIDITTNLQLQKLATEQVQSKVLNYLMPIFGAAHVKVAAHLTLDFDEHSIEKMTFSPVVDEEGIIRSYRETVESVRGYYDAAGVAGIDPNGAAPVYPEVTGDTGQVYLNNTKEINYEIDQMLETITKAKGAVTELTISVAVDSTGLDEDTLDDLRINLRAIVGAAVGILPEERPDRVEVQFMPFAAEENDGAVQEQYFKDRENERMLETIRTIALYVILALAIVVVAMSVVGLFKKSEPEPELLFAEGPDMQQAELDEYGELLDLATGDDLEDDGDPFAVQKSTARQLIEDFIHRDPSAAASLLRNWINEDSRR